MTRWPACCSGVRLAAAALRPRLAARAPPATPSVVTASPAPASIAARRLIPAFESFIPCSRLAARAAARHLSSIASGGRSGRRGGAGGGGGGAAAPPRARRSAVGEGLDARVVAVEQVLV